MARPTPGQMEELWRLVKKGLVTSMHIQFVIDRRADINTVLIKVPCTDGQPDAALYSFIGSALCPEHLRTRWPKGGVRLAKMGFVAVSQDISIAQAHSMVNYMESGYGAPDICETEAFLRAHPETLEDGPIVALCGVRGTDSSGQITGMAIVEAVQGRIELDWKFDSYVLKAGTRLLGTCL